MSSVAPSHVSPVSSAADLIVSRARDFAINAHGDQRYGTEPYRVHLGAVVQVLRDFEFGPDMLAAGWLHDTLEDTGVARIAVARQFGARVASLVDTVTGEGETRKDRNRVIYRKIAAFPAGAVLKLADRIANVEAAEPGSRHFHRYAKEQHGFERAIRPRAPAEMWARLERAFRPSPPSEERP